MAMFFRGVRYSTKKELNDSNYNAMVIEGYMNKNEYDLKKLDLIMTLTMELPVLSARLGFSQEKMAQNIGVSRQTYGAIEKGTRKMTWTIFMALLAVLDLNEATSVMLDQIPGFIQSVRSLIRDSY